MSEPMLPRVGLPDHAGAVQRVEGRPGASMPDVNIKVRHVISCPPVAVRVDR